MRLRNLTSAMPLVQWSNSVALALVVFLLMAGCAGDVETARVIRVIDGDTIVVEGGYHVRYIGIDAPEKDDPYYLEAKQFNEQLVMGKRVKMEKDVSDRDDFGRLLRYVYVNSVFVNAEMVRNGYALAKAYLPDTRYQKYLVEVENEAKQLHKGLWK